MFRQKFVATFGAVLLGAGSLSLFAIAADSRPAAAKGGDPVDFFQAMDEGLIDAKFIAKNDRAARVVITNKGDQPLNLQLPQAFAGVPVLAQARGGGGFGGGNRGGTSGGGNQSVGGGFGGGGMGGGMMGGGGMFSVPADQTVKINVPVLCLDHGKENPSSSNPYKIVPAAAHIDRPEVIELLKGFASGKLDHGAAQAAAWHLNNDLSWEELTAKLEGTKRSTSRAPYFSSNQIFGARQLAKEAHMMAVANREEHELAAAKAKEREEKLAAMSSEERSTEADKANEPTDKAAEDEEEKAEDESATSHPAEQASA